MLEIDPVALKEAHDKRVEDWISVKGAEEAATREIIQWYLDAVNRNKHSADWNCTHGVPHKQCGSCYDQTEPPMVEGLGGEYKQNHNPTWDNRNCHVCGCTLPQHQQWCTIPTSYPTKTSD